MITEHPGRTLDVIQDLLAFLRNEINTINRNLTNPMTKKADRSDDKESDGVNRPSIAFDLYLLFLLLYTCASIMDFVIKFVLTF